MIGIKPHYKRVFISDTHIGHPQASVDKLIGFLDECTFDELYLLGDIFDDKIRRHFIKDYVGDDVLLVAAYLKKRHQNEGFLLVRLSGNHDPKILAVDETIPLTPQPYLVDGNCLLTHGHHQEYLWRAGELVNRLRRTPVKRLPAKALPLRERAAAYTGVFRRLALLKRRYPSINTVIHGHLHTPGVRTRAGVTLICLTDWLDHDGGALVEYNNGGRALIRPDHTVAQQL